MEGFLLHFRVAVKRATTNSTPIIVPVTISRAKSHTGFDEFLAWCFDLSSVGMCFALTTSGRGFVGGTLPAIKVPSLSLAILNILLNRVAIYNVHNSSSSIVLCHLIIFFFMQLLEIWILFMCSRLLNKLLWILVMSISRGTYHIVL